MTNSLDRIESKDISVVVQGPINPIATNDCLKNITKYLPEAEIILSTWEGEKTESLNYDKLILNKDPSATYSDLQHKVFNNYNRQLLSTQAGIRIASRKYILKVRSDIILKSSKFIYYFNRFPKRNDKYSVFNKRILVSSIYTRYRFLDEKKEYNKPVLHLSDWIFFGLTQDITNYFNSATFVEEPHFSQFFNSVFFSKIERCYPTALWKFPPEQQLAISSLVNNFPELKGIPHYSINNSSLAQLSKDIILHNFIVLDPSSWKFSLRKSNYRKITDSISNLGYFEFKTIYRESLFIKDYRSFINSPMPTIDMELIKHFLRPKIFFSAISYKLNIFHEARAVMFHSKEMIKSFISIFKKAFGNYL